jgi:prepilin-type processing-associated H-X9-DG protein/prepilin-type N-terminal cleavage/methylation domain-containing protein
MKTKRGFTILELLCVLAIIFLLMGLLLPALCRVRQQSTVIICHSYLRNYGMAGQLYIDDNDGMFPEGAEEWLYTKKSVSDAHPIGCRWHDRAMAPGGEIMNRSPEYEGKMWAYISEMSIGPCPTFRRFAESRGCENPSHNNRLDINPQSSYTINGYLGSTKPGGVLKISEVRDPSEVFFFAEENSWSLRPDHPEFRIKWLSAALSTKGLDDTVLEIRPTPEAKDCFATYHGGGSRYIDNGSGNVVFVDGHVESISAKDQLRKTMHGGKSNLGPGGNLFWAWASKSPPPGGWDSQ